MEPCARCPHPRGAHTEDRCIINGCGCIGFLNGDEPVPSDAPGPRRVSVEVPDGYIVTVTLTPIGATDA